LKDSLTRATLGIPCGKELNAFVPKHSLLVFDQVENESLDETTGKYVRSLATESRRAPTFHVVICVSSLKETADLLNLNGRDKLSPLIPIQEVKWTDQQVDAFVDKRFVHMREDERKLIKRMGCVTKCPGFLMEVYSMMEDGATVIDTQRQTLFEGMALEYEKKWTEFETLEKDMRLIFS
jgi:hypothetical protein